MLNLKMYGYVKAKNKRALIKAMSQPMTPTEIHKKCKFYNEKMSFNNCSDNLRLFVKKGIAVCINEEEKRNRIYILTKEGEEVRIAVLKEDGN